MMLLENVNSRFMKDLKHIYLFFYMVYSSDYLVMTRIILMVIMLTTIIIITIIKMIIMIKTEIMIGYVPFLVGIMQTLIACQCN